MSYYPKSQVKTNLYANFGEYLINSTEEPYQGFYWKNSKGEFYTGRTPNDVPSQQLTPTFDPVNEFISPVPANPISEVVTTDLGYILSRGIRVGDVNNYRALPNYISNPPTQQDYQIGEFRRYFCKKANEIFYLEIDKNTYDNLVAKNSQYLWQLYPPFNLPWQIMGDKQQVARTNKNIVDLTSQRLKLPRFGDYLNSDYTKYFKFPNISNLYTSGGEFKTKDGQNYIGFYHIHDNSGPMVGKTHTKESHGLLFPINETIISGTTTQYNNQSMMSPTGSQTPTIISNTNTGGGSYSGGGGGGGGGY